MSMNIFNIEQKFYAIFAELEENGGELTEELAKELEVTQENFIAKIKGYGDYVKALEADVDAIKKEVARLNALKKSKESRIARLESIMIEAIDKFGSTNKQGNKYVEGSTFKYSVSPSKSVEVNNLRVLNTIDNFIEYATEMNNAGVLGTDDIDIDSLVEVINANELAKWEDKNRDVEGAEPYIPITAKDLSSINVNFEAGLSLGRLCDKQFAELLKCRENLDYILHVNNATSKSDVKVLADNGSCLGTIVINKNLRSR